MLVQTLILLIAVCSLVEIRRHERQIIARYINRRKQPGLNTIEEAKEDEKSLNSALHSSKVALWIITVLSAINFIHCLFL